MDVPGIPFADMNSSSGLGRQVLNESGTIPHPDRICHQIAISSIVPRSEVAAAFWTSFQYTLGWCKNYPYW
jgi:hypothetical protein